MIASPHSHSYYDLKTQLTGIVSYLEAHFLGPLSKKHWYKETNPLASRIKLQVIFYAWTHLLKSAVASEQLHRETLKS